MTPLAERSHEPKGLSVRGLTAEFDTKRGKVHAVNGVSFDVRPGAIVGLVGESGCGKSATIRSMLGLTRYPGRVTAGQVHFDGQDILALPRKELRALRAEEIGFVAQNPFGALNPILKLKDQFRNLIRAHRGRVGTSECDRMATAMLASVGIPGPQRVMDGYAHELSGGMAQRVVIAMAMVLDPRLVVADEPTTALDVTIQRQILDLMRGMVREEGRSMLVVTHDLGVVAQYCDDVVVMYAGKVVETGSAAEIFRRPAHPYTEALLASVPRRGQQVNVLRGRVPDLVDYPSGCPFAPRCAHRHDRCDVEAPGHTAIAGEPGGRTASCHLVTEGRRAHEPAAS